MMFAGHYVVHAYALAALAQTAWDLAGRPGGWAEETTGQLWIVVLGCIFAEYAQHMNHLCERCARATPLDPEPKVRRWKALLRLVHVNSLFWIWLGIGIIRIVIAHVTRGAVLLGSDLACTGVTTVLMFSVLQHRRLQPWCPWCNWPKGGEHEEVPDPDPAVSL